MSDVRLYAMMGNTVGSMRRVVMRVPVGNVACICDSAALTCRVAPTMSVPHAKLMDTSADPRLVLERTLEDAVAPEAKACSACGFLLEIRKPVQHRVAYRWESGWSFRTRLFGFLVCQALAWMAVISGTVAGMSPFTFIFPYVMFTGMTAFLFGSYNWVDLARNKKGKLRLTQTWRICFFARPITTLRVRDYEEVATGMEHQFDTSDWIMLLFLFLLGILPGLWWWFYVGSKDTYFVSLCRDHGYPVVTLYRGWNREQMEDMAETICSVAELPLRR